MSVSRLRLISHHLCPYVQRVAISLLEKGIPFERQYVDLANKPDWFCELSPLGKVPLLVVTSNDRSPVTLFESAAICEYLEDAMDATRLHPADPLVRARHRAWIEFGTSILADIWGLETATEADLFEVKRSAIAAKFGRLESEVDNGGPYFAGGRFTLVDAVFAPIFRYFDVFDHIADTRVFDGLPKVSKWREALAGRPSVIDAVTGDYTDRLRQFLERKNAWLLRMPTRLAL